ncbi:MAG: signal peptide peptidase SppA [SAR324 cluster bacterium]|nr:signal peptide peptidase SppA [SAR324 cluster bacterium]
MPFSLNIPQNKPPRKKSIRSRFPVLLSLFVFVLLIIGYSILNKTVSPPLIGVIPIEGIILESETTIKKLRELEADPQVKGIIVRINSPGGAVAPSQEIFSELIRIKPRKKIYASMSSVAASGGYYVAIGAEKIFANPGSLTGSIGVIMQSFNVQKLMNRIGINIEIIKSGKNKDIGSSFRPMKTAERKLLESVLEDTHRQFVSAVQKNRPMIADRMQFLADGRIFTGQQALQHGLIDELASFRETVEEMRKALGITEAVQLYYPLDKKDAFLSIFDLETILPIKRSFTYTGLFYLGSFFNF